MWTKTNSKTNTQLALEQIYVNYRQNVGHGPEVLANILKGDLLHCIQLVKKINAEYSMQKKQKYYLRYRGKCFTVLWEV